MARPQGQRTDDNQGSSVNATGGKTSKSPSHGQAAQIPNINTDQGNGHFTPKRRSR